MLRANRRKLRLRSGSTRMMASATLRVASAGDPLPTRTARSTPDAWPSFSCMIARYIVGGTPSRGERYTASLTRPTISNVGDSSPGEDTSRTVLPIGFEPPKYFFANVSLTRMTLGDAAVSRVVRSRPARIGVPYVANHPGVIALTQTSRSGFG